MQPNAIFQLYPFPPGFMKRLLSFFLLLLLGAGCKKTEHQYTVVCDFPLLFRGQAWLVVTNDAATILQIFDLPQGATQFIGKFNLEADHAPDTYNLHLVFKSDTYPDSKVASYYGVQNGAAVSFWPFTLYAVLPRVTLRRVFIRGIEAVDSPDLSIRSALFSPLHTLRILTGGHPDLVEVNILAPASNQLLPTFQWNIQGPPEAFVQMALPDLSSFLPAWFSLSAVRPSIRVDAYQYDHLNYSQLREGFPYKANAERLFPKARYGLKRIFKYF